MGGREVSRKIKFKVKIFMLNFIKLLGMRRKSYFLVKKKLFLYKKIHIERKNRIELNSFYKVEQNSQSLMSRKSAKMKDLCKINKLQKTGKLHQEN